MVDLEEGERVALHGATGVERRYLSAYDTDERGLRTDDPTAKVRETINEGNIAVACGRQGEHGMPAV